MKSVGGGWQVRLTSAADTDIAKILGWTLAEFGSGQMRRYSKLLRSAVAVLAGGPDVQGARKREEIGPGLRTLHVTPGSRKGRHFVLFRVAATETGQIIEVLRVLHDAMDLTRHWPEES
ncbi:type II toxin-antitoxin system RelE/ParE family toxin [Nevskia sp.]|uniref:type II toxin-antitoxin system RelE/ParE family toxin n=1 Tax=Nevskia sp. TaxID=1929292 RepID=UPI0025E77C5A|nr:type II toxin-antitoxin system RelE/ParE family toxin [Nevskia sp.]